MLLTDLMGFFAMVFASDIIVLEQGQLRGHHLTSRKGRNIFAYQGIPYAKPPVGDLRFRPPQKPAPWRGVLDAFQDGPQCVQRNLSDQLVGSEDCLYLNVYTTQAPGSNKKNLDVMFWIHGGGWVAGSGGINEFGPQYLLDYDVVLVSINYRLGALGFLSTGDKECPGNNGMKDQVAALHWVKNNIHAFGGNPNSVTIFGESAGGASAHYHMLSPLSQGLFHRAISQSGTALVNWASAPNGSTTHHTRKLASLLLCPTGPSKSTVSCLRKRDAFQIADQDRQFTEWDADPMFPFNIVVESEVGKDDEAFMSMTPQEAVLHCNNPNSVPWIVGINSGEGAADVTRIFRNKTLVEEFDHCFDEILPIVMYFSQTAEPTEVKSIAEKIRKFYFGDLPVNNDTWRAFRDMYTDGDYLHGTDEAVEIQSQKKAPVYYYYFDYRGTYSYSSFFMPGDYGVAHQDELLYLFPQDHLFPKAPKKPTDDKMVDILTVLWANFAHTGNPTPGHTQPITWKQVSSPNNPEYAHINSEGLDMRNGLLKERSAFWASLPLQAERSLKTESFQYFRW